jgi:hypothetical protein
MHFKRNANPIHEEIESCEIPVILGKHSMQSRMLEFPTKMEWLPRLVSWYEFLILVDSVELRVLHLVRVL